MIDEQNAFEVVEFMLETDGIEAVDLFLDALVVAVQIGDADSGRAFDGVEILGQGQAALLVLEQLVRRPQEIGRASCRERVF